jgi:hypothetical protein
VANQALEILSQILQLHFHLFTAQVI